MTVQPDFPGKEELTRLLDTVVAEPDITALTRNIKNSLCTLISSEAFKLPACCDIITAGDYARRLLHRDPDGRYTVVAMTWGPEQGTPLHDHAGMWCVEAVCGGEISVQQYECVAEREGRYRFREGDVVRAGLGSAGCLIPPHEYHRIFNSSAHRHAVSLHVYGGDMETCCVYAPIGDGWYEKQEKKLGYVD